jgi:hypothetical protein
MTDKRTSATRHSDHLGGSNTISDPKGQSYEHMQHFPYSEMWVDE